MKNSIYIGLITFLIILGMAIYGLFHLYNMEKDERKRVSENYIALLTGRSKQQDITVREFKTLYPKYDSLANALNIKAKTITNVIETRYNYKDTTISKTVISHDSLKEKRLFSINDKCYHFSGYIDRDTLALTEKQVNDNITTFLYKDWRHKYFFNLIKTKPYYTAKVFSKCVNDTISVENNIAVIHK